MVDILLTATFEPYIVDVVGEQDELPGDFPEENVGAVLRAFLEEQRDVEDTLVDNREVDILEALK